LLPGSTYLGQAISDSVQGQFNPATGSFLWSATGSWGDPVDWSVQGAITPIEINPNKPTWQLPSIETVMLRGIGSFQNPDSVTLIGDGKTTPALSIRNSSLLDNLGRPLVQSIGTDTYDATKNVFNFKEVILPKFQVPLIPFSDETNGTTPFTGGAGTYTTTINSIPEPSAIVMFALGTVGVVSCAWRTKKAARPR
jgi:hypothetical protein